MWKIILDNTVENMNIQSEFNIKLLGINFYYTPQYKHKHYGVVEIKSKLYTKNTMWK